MRHTEYTGEQAFTAVASVRYPRHAPGVSQDLAATYAALQKTTSRESFMHASYKYGDTIVEKGCITSRRLKAEDSFTYASVPLGVITSGEVIVLQNGIAVRRLRPGDFVGLFETSFYLSSKRTRTIGTWTLVADTDVKILFFSKHTFSRRDARAKALRSSLLELSLNDTVPKPITHLPILDTVANSITPSLLEDTIIIAHTHIFPSSVALMRHLAHLVGYKNLFVVEKAYSTVPSAYNAIAKMGAFIAPTTLTGNTSYDFAQKRSLDLVWNQVLASLRKKSISRILLMDDGGALLQSVPWGELEGVEVTGVEQTRFGIRQLERTTAPIPATVNVASSHVKVELESQFIAHGIISKLASTGMLDDNPRVGIVGVGAVGEALRTALHAKGIHAPVYDVTLHKREDCTIPGYMTSIDAVFESSDIIIGCTGEDITQGVAFERIEGEKVLVSASSKDIEFFSLLNQAPHDVEPFSTISMPLHKNLTVKILNGGYPINFDRVHEWEPANDIQVTRTLMYAGLMQALKLPKGAYGIFPLNDTVQKKIVAAWQKDRGIS